MDVNVPVMVNEVGDTARFVASIFLPYPLRSIKGGKAVDLTEPKTVVW